MGKKTVQTDEGDVEYETKTCTICENEVIVDDIYTAVVGDLQKEYNLSMIHKWKFEFDPIGCKTCKVCKHCAEELGEDGDEQEFWYRVISSAKRAILS